MIHWVEFAVFAVLFLAVTVLGFVASRWRRGASLDHLDEWGLGGRKFGSWITWFLVGGDLYTAYTFVAVPALLFGAGALGFYALPYTVVLYPLVFLPVLRLWSVSRVHGYVTPADFVAGRYDSSLLALVIAVTGIVATMPYIALQLAGLEAVLRTMGLNGVGLAGHLPLFIAFVILAAVHLPVRAARPGADRVRQGHPDLPGHPGRGDLPAGEVRRLVGDHGRLGAEAGQDQPGHRRPGRLHPADRGTTSCSTSRWRSARRWRCSSIRTR